MMSHRLRDGTRLIIRPVAPHDAAAFAANFTRYSETARANRFGAAKPRLSASELRYLTSVDHHDHEALLAIDPATADCIAVGRYVRYPDRPDAAELAIIVRDDWQRRGVALLLADLLAERARAEGIAIWHASALHANRPAIELAFRLGFVVTGNAGGWLELERPLATGERPAASGPRYAAA
jgi:RimJ/RimL family protein N-acetyltransferase